MLAIEPVRLRRLQSLRSTEPAFAAILLFGLLGMTARVSLAKTVGQNAQRLWVADQFARNG
jgi:hypothetical protein